MLVLSRKKNEGIMLDNDKHIIVVEIRGDKVRLGVEAPKECPVHRDEVYKAIHREDAVPQIQDKGDSLQERVEKGGAEETPQWLEFLARTYLALDSEDQRTELMMALTTPSQKLLRTVVKWFPEPQ